MKPIHAADAEYEAKAIIAIREADHFVASVFIGRGQYLTADATTVKAALELAMQIEQDQRCYSRKAIIYAVSAKGDAVMLPGELIARLMAMPFQKEIAP